MRWSLALAAVALVLALGGCVTEATSVRVVVDSDLPADLPLALRVWVRRGDAPIDRSLSAPDLTFERGAPDGGLVLPASFGIVPGADAPRDDAVSVLIEGVSAGVSIRRSLRFRFVPQSSLTLRVFLTIRCSLPRMGCRSLTNCTQQSYCEERGETCGDDGECVAVSQMPVRDAGTYDAVVADLPADVPPDRCVPDCATRACGESDGCGGTCTSGRCGTNESCVAGRCECQAGFARCGAADCVSASTVACQPGQTRMDPCGNCGTRQSTCSSICAWEAAMCVEPPGACTTGSTRVEACGRCGSQSQTCNAACAWENVGTCDEGTSVCTTGQSRVIACGRCGMQTQSCSAACQWVDSGTCVEPAGACTPGSTESRACGNCGRQTRTCGATCAWGAYSTCTMPAGACAPGSTRAGSCDACSQQVCTSSCTWAACSLRTGNACEWRSGLNARACTRCRCGQQWCLSSCQWSTACVSCCGTCGGCL